MSNAQITLAELEKERAAARSWQDQLQAGIGQCAREKSWSECSIEEKIERTRDRVHRQEEEIEALRRRLGRARAAIERLSNHQHGSDGRVLVSIHAQEDRDEVSELRPKSRESAETYF